MTEIMREETTNGDEMVMVPSEVVDLIAGLKMLGDSEGLSFPLKRLEVLSRIVDESTDAESWNPETALECAFWQRKIIEEIQHILDAQDSIVMRLHGLIDTPKENESIAADFHSIRALRGLANLFLTDNLLYTDSVKGGQLKAWCLSNGYAYEAVKEMLTNKPPLIAEGRKKSSVLAAE